MLKKIALLVLALLSSSCTLQPIDPVTRTDFRPSNLSEYFFDSASHRWFYFIQVGPRHEKRWMPKGWSPEQG
jgi:hypothetical protein